MGLTGVKNYLTRARVDQNVANRHRTLWRLIFVNDLTRCLVDGYAITIAQVLDFKLTCLLTNDVFDLVQKRRISRDLLFNLRKLLRIAKGRYNELVRKYGVVLYQNEVDSVDEGTRIIPEPDAKVGGLPGLMNALKRTPSTMAAKANPKPEAEKD